MEVKIIEQRLSVLQVPSMYVKDLESKEYPVQATYTLEQDLNGNQNFASTITSNKVNDAFIQNLAEMWVITDHDGTEYKIKYAKKKGHGNRLTVDVKAVPLFFDEMDADRVYKEHTAHMTAQEYFSIVFAGTGYKFILNGHFEAIQWEAAGKGETKLKLFKDGIDRYEAEFNLIGTTVYLEEQIGRDTNFMYRHKLNASNIVQEIDGSEFYTYVKGFGNYEQENEANAKLVREYLSPLASLPGIGVRHAPPIYDGRITNPDTMDANLITLVDESLKVSVSATIHDLRKQGYDLAQPMLGDRIFLIDERIKLDSEVRVVSLSIKKDWKGNILDLKLTFGSQSLTKRYQSNLNTAVNRITELIEGRRQLPMSALDAAVRVATKALKSAQTELKFTENGILAIDKTDPNYVTIFNSAGIGVSSDGGATFGQAITGAGMVADYITSGTMLANRILGGEFYLGGEVNGKMFILDSSGEVIADFDADRGGFSDLYVANLISPTVVSRNEDDLNFHVNTVTGSDENEGTHDNPFQTVQAALNKIGRYNEGLVTINVLGHSSERLFIYGFLGSGKIVINYNTYRLDGTIRTASNSNQIEVNQCTFNNPSYETIATIYSSKDNYVSYTDCRVFGQNTCDFGVYALNGSLVILNNCEINNVREQAIRAERLGQIIVKNCKGQAKYGLVTTDGGMITGGGSAPTGTVSNTYTTYGGQIIGSFSFPVIAPPTPPPSPSTTDTWNSTGGDSWRNNFGGQWFSDGYGENAVVQGYYGGYGVYRGLWLFGSSPSSAVTGKTIKSMRLYVKRKANGGRSGNVTCYFKPHTYTSRPSGAPSFQSPTTQASLRWGEGKWINIPSSFYAGFQSGLYKGIGIYIDSTSSANYSKFYVDAKLEISYE
jgi:hypothetical protein